MSCKLIVLPLFRQCQMNDFFREHYSCTNTAAGPTWLDVPCVWQDTPAWAVIEARM